MKRVTQMPPRERVQDIRDLFVLMGGDLDQPDVMPPGIWGAMKQFTTNTRWPRYLYPDMDPYVDWVVVERALEGDQDSLERMTRYEYLDYLERLDRRLMECDGELTALYDRETARRVLLTLRERQRNGVGSTA